MILLNKQHAYKSNLHLAHSIVKPLKNNTIIKRYMFNRLYKTSTRLYNQNMTNEMIRERSFAAIAGKSKFPKTFLEQQTKKDIQTEINPHAQYITDFNLIYENPKDIQLFSIGSLHTNPVPNSHKISEEQNYKQENKTQQIKFFKTPVKIIADIQIVKDSKKYFDDVTIKETIENTIVYKALFNDVLKELQAKAIKVKIAETSEELKQTGFHVLVDLNPLQDRNTLFETLSIKNVKD